MSAEHVSAPAVRLNAEIGTVMLVTFGQASQTIKALFVGMEPGAYLIIRFPTGIGVHDHLYEGNELVVKFISSGKVYGFRSEVLGYMFKKRLILAVVAFPKAVESHDLRKEQRVEFLLPAQLIVGGQTIKGAIVDLSTSGCRFSLDSAHDILPFNSANIKKVELAFQMFGIDGIRKLICLIKNVQADTRPLALGLEFENPDETVSESIRRYIRDVSSFLES